MMYNRNAKTWQTVDWLTVLIYFILVITGWLNIYAATYNEEHSSIFDMSQKYGRQLIWIIAAFFLVTTIMLIDSRVFLYFSYPIYITVLLLLVAVLFFGIEINSSRSWFSIGILRIQPSEIAKFATILALSNYLSQQDIKLMTARTLLTVGAIILIPATLTLLQNDTGTTILFASPIIMLFREGLPFYVLLTVILAVVLFIMVLTQEFYIVMLAVIICTYLYALIKSRFRKHVTLFGAASAAVISLAFFVRKIANFEYDQMWIFIFYLLLIAPLVLYYAFMNKSPHIWGTYAVALLLTAFSYSADYIYDNLLQSHQRDRIDLLMGVNVDPLGAGYNVNQSKIAIGSGGFTGKGFLEGTQTKYDFVPEQSTDFIFCTIGEEWGFVGSTVVVLLFLTLLLRLIYLAERQPLKFSRLYGYGVISFIFAHVFINIGMTMGIMPVIGIPLPFFSYGGSSLWAFTILLFVFIRLDSARGMYVK